ncbi:putative mediator of RNA polymerase II transcription subunit 33A [Iris pallida]|uniref:Mediator of RNA polymerase II transcription subunit 33A n=1 Tax=Iris pallida TaxID=29817 RepID=A0AAX6F6U3_IRIPA|nr:putative mediator of RNA polymerase II transcription subunit 33A [Iris pallida]
MATTMEVEEEEKEKEKETVGGERGEELVRTVMAAVKASEERGDPPLLRAMEASRCVPEEERLDLASILVSNLCFSSNTPSLWKLLEQAVAARIVSPVLTLALLTARVIPCRREEPEAYTLYLELLNRYLFSHGSMESAAHRDKITEIIDNALQLSHTYGIQNIDFGHIMVFFVLHVIMSLVDGTLEDWGLPFVSTDKQHNVYANEGDQVMDIDPKENSNDRRHVHREELRRANSLMALEVVEKITANKSAKVLLRLIHLNMPEKYNGLLQRLLFIEDHKSTSQSLVSANYILVKLSANVQKASADSQLNRNHFLGILLNAKTCIPTSRYNSGAGRSACWISFHMFMENAMDGKNLHAMSAVDILTELTKTLQVINQASWQETFQALWISALCLVQRDNERWEGPMPRLVARLCMLLSIVPLAIVPIVKEECKTYDTRSSNEHGKDGNNLFSRRKGLISSLQILGQFSELISPPPSVVNAANDAASKAATFISIVKSGNPSPNIVSHNDASVQAVGNMLHLIVEACIARKLIDTSAYFWPGYVVSSAPSKDSVSLKEPPWSTFMDGAQLISSLRNALMVTPASSITELDKLYNIALNGPEEEKASAAMILCGATLTHGWNIQEHVVHTVIKLLTPVPPDFSGPCAESHLIDYMPMLSAILFGLANIDIVHILALYGKVPEVAAALLPLCEAFGSVAPPSNYRSSPSDMTSIYSVFSCAFLFLLRLWKFYKSPQEHTIAGRGGPVKLELTLDYLFLMRNRRIALRNSLAKNTCRNSTDSLNSHCEPVYIDSFPKMRGWYLQNQACIASTLSGLCSKNPVHQVANKLLNMMCRKMIKVGNVSGNPSPIPNASITAPGSSAQDVHVWPILPAWEVLEAIPFVLEAVLTACAHGRLSSRDMTTGLRDLVDFLPASLATIVSYFSAEITRGIWKPVSMNGTDWPSPSAHLLSVESEIMDVLSSAGVHVPKCYECGMDPILPLPMAALVSLTITFKLDKSLSYIFNVVGQALENCASGCSWPSMPIIGALWTQKVSRWHDYIIFACALSPFTRDKSAVAQLIRSCFSSFLGQDSPHLTSHGGINGLLGHTISNGGAPLPISPGFLYLRTCRTFRDTHFVSSVILSLVVERANVLAARCSSSGPICLKSAQSSLASAAAGVREAATLGASLLCIAGGGQLVQVLYEETLPMSLLSERPGKEGTEDVGPMSVLEGYAMAYFVILCGVYVWGVRDRSPTYSLMFVSKRARALGVHMECMVEVIEGNIAVKCDAATLKAYVTCLVGLLVELVPAWVPGIKKEVLLRIVNGLRVWHEGELALELLKCGGVELMTAVVESVL